MSDEVPIEVHTILERISVEVSLQPYRAAHAIRFWKGETNPRSAVLSKIINLASETCLHSYERECWLLRVFI